MYAALVLIPEIKNKNSTNIILLPTDACYVHITTYAHGPEGIADTSKNIERL